MVRGRSDILVVANDDDFGLVDNATFDANRTLSNDTLVKSKLNLHSAFKPRELTSFFFLILLVILVFIDLVVVGLIVVVGLVVVGLVLIFFSFRLAIFRTKLLRSGADPLVSRSNSCAAMSPK